MGLIKKLETAAVEQSLGKSTAQCYSFWTRKFYAFCQRPGSEWTGPMVRETEVYIGGAVQPAASEAELYALLDLPFIEPRDRELYLLNERFGA